MTKRPALAWENTREFFEKVFRELQSHGPVDVYVTPEQIVESQRALEARRKAAAKERRAKKKSEQA